MKGRILVAEDDPAILKLLETNLQVAGYEVVCAENGAQALNIFRPCSVFCALRVQPVSRMMEKTDGEEPWRWMD